MTPAVDLSVIAPCLNEEGNVNRLVERIHQALAGSAIRYEIVLVDDGSTDSTWNVISDLQALDGERIKAVRHERNMGIVSSWRSGLSTASAGISCLIDADLQNPPEAIPDLWSQLMTGRSHIVQATRSSIEWNRDARYRASRGLNWLLNVVFRDSAHDNKSGFLLAPTDVLLRTLTFRKKYRYPQTFVRVAARSRGYSVGEVETLFEPRRAGKSFLSNRSALRVYFGVLQDVVRAIPEFRVAPLTAVHEHYLPRNRSSQISSPKQASASQLGLDLYFASMPTHAWLLRPSTKDIYYWLQDSQWMSATDLRELQFERLQRLLWHAYINVPYYRSAFDEAGFHPRFFTALEDLGSVPLLSKEQVSANLYMRLFSQTHRKNEMLKIATSGSTGTPFVTYADRQQLEFRFATTLRCVEWTGWRFGEKQVRLWHQRLGMSRSQIVRERVDAWMMRRTFVPAFELDDVKMRHLVDTLNRIRPTLIDGYAESLNFLGQYLKSGVELKFQPSGLLSSAQMLTRQTRSTIESALGAKVHDKYGAREFSGIAYECKEGSLKHIMDESYIVEVVKEGRPALPGETGEVVITDLNNFSVPLIRYRIGDLAQAVDNASACECGRGLSRIGDVQGRTQAIVHCANGRWLPGTFFAHFFKDYEHLLQFFQVIQERHGEFTLRTVKGKHWTQVDWDRMLSHLREYIGDTSISVEYVQAIPLLATGKRTPVVSHVRADFQDL